MPAVRRPIPDMPSQGIRRKSTSTSTSASAAASASAGPDGSAPSRHPARFRFASWELRTGAGRGRTSEYDVLGAAYFPLRFSEEGASFRRTVFGTVFYAPLGFAGKQFGTECGFRRMVFLHRIPCSPGDRETGPDGVRSASFVFVPNRAGRTAASCGFAGRLPFVPALHGGVQCAAEAIAPPLPLPEEGIKTLPAADRPGHLTLLAFAGGGGAGGARSPIPIPSGGCGPRRHPSRRVRDVRDRSFRRLRRNDRDRKSQAGAPRPPRRPDPRSSCKTG